jgi:peptidoglycan/LPS O-acetylase OafA/YrhL
MGAQIAPDADNAVLADEAPRADATAGGVVDSIPTPTDPGKQSRAASHIPIVAAFDGYRAYAILGIIVLHLLGFSGVLAALGSSWFPHLIQGTLDQFVDILFIISGFVVFLPTVARHGQFGSVPSYAIRRAARLVPAYWAVLAIVVILAAAVAVNPPIPMPSIANVGLHTIFLHMPGALVDSFGPGLAADTPLWTLSLEVTFYVILPFVASWYVRRPFVGLVVAAVLTVAWQEALLHWSTTEAVLGHPSDAVSERLRLAWSFQFPFFAFSFGAGMTGAWVYVHLRERYSPETLARHVGWVQLVSLISLAVFCYLLGSHKLGQGLAARYSPFVAMGFTGSLTTLMVATALGRMRWQRPFAHPFARRLGDISYGMYLIHFVIITYAVRLLFGHPPIPGGPQLTEGDGSLGTFVALAALVLPLTVLYGYVSGRYLEQPIRRWAHRFGRREQDRAVGAKPVAGESTTS